ncbi:MAG TPA: hypothetical protein VMZ71_07385, partial [Gemmataceae bacterium]|nr:hypothetical protein [Gemmataceae bacterium]
RRRRYDDDDDDDYYDRPRRRRRRRRSSGGANVGKAIAIIAGVLAGIGVVIAIVLAINGRGFSSGSMNYADYTAISDKDTIEGLEKKHGRGRKIDPSEWARTTPGGEQPRGGFGDEFGGRGNTPLAGYNDWAKDVTAWYRWKKGKEEVYVAEGTDLNGRKGLVLKLYFNPKVIEDFVRNPSGPKPTQPWWTFEQIGVGGKVQFGGNVGNPR